MRPDDSASEATALSPADAEKLDALLGRAARRPGPVVAFTGAGISAASGIPTFRGPEGIWTVGSRHYRPEDLATRAAFQLDPIMVWDWYLYRRRICSEARPNAGHLALAGLDRVLGERFLLVTQNVDGLHLAAGHAPERTLQVHGNLHFQRCAAECGAPLLPLTTAASPATDPTAFRCHACGAWSRPHVLWFDETYDEARYRFESALRAVERAALLLVVGTSGAVTIAAVIEQIVRRHGTAIVNVDPSPNPFSALALSNAEGASLQGPATALLPEVARRIEAVF